MNMHVKRSHEYFYRAYLEERKMMRKTKKMADKKEV